MAALQRGVTHRQKRFRDTALDCRTTPFISLVGRTKPKASVERDSLRVRSAERRAQVKKDPRSRE